MTDIVLYCMLFALPLVVHPSPGDSVTVTTKYGTIRGRRLSGYNIGAGGVTSTVDVFKGVPYAAPPVENLRFQPPRPPPNWEDILDTVEPGPVCPQPTYYTQTAAKYQSENCLSLDIYTPVQSGDSSNGTARVPVMVFVHGGSYEEGAGSRYDGVSLAQHGVVVVTINYRLGLLGFLSNGEESLPGNYGILDQIEALRWVSDNIGNFRGDSCSVTLFGSSAGSASVGLLLLSPKARGLFHRVILQSGSPLAVWSVYNETVDYASFYRNVTDTLGCDQDTFQDRQDCLMDTHFSNLTYNYPNFTRIVPSKLNYKPRVDGDIIPDQPHRMFSSSRYQNVSVMIGTLQDEWSRSMGFFFNDIENSDVEFEDGLDRPSFERSVHHVFQQRFWWPPEVADAAIFVYTDWRDVTDPFVNREAYQNMMSDFIMIAPSVTLAETLADQGTTVYYYNFNHTSEHTKPQWWRCYHSLELDYVFGSPFNGYNIAVDAIKEHSQDDKDMSRIIMLLWTSFAKHGNPTPAPVRHVSWAPLDPSLDNYLHISLDHLEMRSHLRADKLAFWNTLVPALKNIPLSVSLSGHPVSDNRTLTLMWFFGILSIISFTLAMALVVRNGQMQKKLQKALTVSTEKV